MTLNVQVESPEDGGSCECCGKSLSRLMSYVFDDHADDEPFAVILTIINHHYREPIARIFVSLAEPDRAASLFAVVAQTVKGRVAMRFVDDPKAKAIPRLAARKHPRRKDAFDAIDAVLRADADLMRHFERPGFDA